MAKLNFAHIAEHAYLLNGTPSIINIFENSKIQAKLPTERQVAIVVNFTPEDTKKHTIAMRLLSPSGVGVIKPHEKELAPSQRPTSNLGYLLNVLKVVFNEYGEYQAQIDLDGTTLTTLKFTILKAA